MDQTSTDLPPEILTDIFLLAQENSGFDPGHLSAVSVLWRDVAISLPKLWSNCTLVLTDDDNGSSLHPPSLQDRPTVWLQRCRDEPFGVDLSFSRFTPESWPKLSSEITGLFHLLGPQLTQLTIRGSPLALFHIFTEAIPASLPVLHSLRIFGTPGGSRARYTPSTNARQNLSLPSLRSLTLSSCFDDELVGVLLAALPRQQITTFTWYTATVIPRESLMFFLQFIVWGSKLTTCDWHISLPILLNPAMVKKYKSLTLRFASSGAIRTITGLTLPVLETLELYNNSWPMPYPASTNLATEWLLALCQRSSFPLTCLKLHNIVLDITLFTQFLRLVPSLLSLTLEYCHCLNSEFLATLGADENTMLPILQHLVISDSYPVTEDSEVMEGIQAVVDSRCSTSNPTTCSLLATLRIRAAEGDIALPPPRVETGLHDTHPLFARL